MLAMEPVACAFPVPSAFGYAVAVSVYVSGGRSPTVTVDVLPEVGRVTRAWVENAL